MARWTGAVTIRVVASGPTTNASMPWLAGYNRYTVYALTQGGLTRIGDDVETWR